jgi:hypothetical protein
MRGTRGGFNPMVPGGFHDDELNHEMAMRSPELQDDPIGQKEAGNIAPFFG